MSGAYPEQSTCGFRLDSLNIHKALILCRHIGPDFKMAGFETDVQASLAPEVVDNEAERSITSRNYALETPRVKNLDPSKLRHAHVFPSQLLCQ